MLGNVVHRTYSRSDKAHISSSSSDTELVIINIRSQFSISSIAVSFIGINVSLNCSISSVAVSFIRVYVSLNRGVSSIAGSRFSSVRSSIRVDGSLQSSVSSVTI